MNIQNIFVENIKPADYNPRTIDQASLDRLVENIRHFGLVDPLIVNADMTLIGGHQRLKAVKILGMQQVACVVLDLDKDKERLLNLSLNKIGGEFDANGLKKLLIDLNDSDVDLALSGFENIELEKFILPPPPPNISEWQLDDNYEPFWIVVRGPLQSLPEIKRALSQIDLTDCQVEASA